MNRDWDEVPEWIQTITQSSDFNGDQRELAEYNFLKGSYMGHHVRVRQLEAQVAELEQQLDLAMAYQRHVDAEKIKQYVWDFIKPTAYNLKQLANHIKLGE